MNSFHQNWNPSFSPENPSSTSTSFSKLAPVSRRALSEKICDPSRKSNSQTASWSMPMKIILCILCLFLWGCEKKQVAKKPVPKVEVAYPEKKAIEVINSYVGTVEPFLQVEIKAQVEGVLTGAYFKEGDQVSQDDLIFTIDSRPYYAQLHKAEGALAQSIANLRYAEDVAKRNAALAQEDYVSQLQYDQYITNVLTTKATIQENEAEIETAEINISYCNIRAPMNAVTGKIQLQVGNLIPNVGETPLVTLNQITPTYVYFSVPQKDLPRIMELHKKEKVQVKAYLNQSKTPNLGSLNLINNELNSQTGTVEMRGIFPNEEKKLWPGEFVDIAVVLNPNKETLLIPTDSIGSGQKGKYVYVIDEKDTAKLQWIQTGQEVGGMTEVIKGLTTADQVAVKGRVNLGDGVQVNVVEGEKQ